MRDHAKAYHELGWGVLAVYKPTPDGGCSCYAGKECTSPGKHPVGGPHDTLSAEEISTLDWGQHNVGVTSSPPGYLPVMFAVDLDGPEGAATWRAWQDAHGACDADAVVLTGGGGMHIYFAHPEYRIANSVRKLGPGVDIRARGGFVVAPPSNHVSGGDYRWVNGITSLTTAPQWLLDKIGAAADSGAGNAPRDPLVADAAINQTPLPDRLAVAERYLQKTPAAVAGKGGNQQTLEAWGVGYSFGLTIDEFRPAMDRYNRKCKPPWSSDELETIAENAYRYTDRPFGWRLAEGQAKRADALAIGALTAEDDGGEKAPVFERGDAPDLAKWLMGKYGAPAHLRSTENGFFIYDPESGIWSERSNKNLRGDIQELQQAEAMILNAAGEWKPLTLPENKINAIINWVWNDKTIVDHEFLIAPPQGIVFRDGFISIVDGELSLEPHDPKHKATVGFPFSLQADAGQDAFWLTFMRNLFQEDEDCDQKIEALQEFVGAAILGIAPQYARCMMLTGEGKNGKSTFIQIIEDLFPGPMRAAISPKNWGEEYYRAKLLGVRLNAVSELPEKLLVSDEFKQMITGETITGRNVKERPFNYTPQAGHIFSVNTLPSTFDNSEGFWRRFLVISFNRNFEKDPVVGGLRTKEEVAQQFRASRGAIAQWGLAGALRLIENREYTIPDSHHVKLEDWRYSTDAVADFVHCCCAANVDGGGSLKDLYKAFVIWADAEGRSRIGKQNFSTRLSTTPGVDRLGRGSEGARFSVNVIKMADWLDYSGPTLVGRL